MIDYGLKRADYIETFFKAIDWTVVANRFSEAVAKVIKYW
ncbi:MAG: Fe-Mn family superoxide dismutase [Candidatus Bathyarchaeia archaeon]